jgi:hypothetical protein
MGFHDVYRDTSRQTGEDSPKVGPKCRIRESVQQRKAEIASGLNVVWGPKRVSRTILEGSGDPQSSLKPPLKPSRRAPSLGAHASARDYPLRRLRSQGTLLQVPKVLRSAGRAAFVLSHCATHFCPPSLPSRFLATLLPTTSRTQDTNAPP